MKSLITTLALGVLGGSAAAQTRGTLGLGVGTVRYSGGSNQNSASLTPGIEMGGSSWSSAFGGTLATLPGSAWYGQARGSFWGAVPVAGRFRLGGDVDAIGTWIVPDSLGNNSSESRMTVEGLWSRPRWGVGVGGGVGLGWAENTNPSSVVAGRGRVRAWWDPTAALSVTGTAEPTYFLSAWYTDVTLGVTGRRGLGTVTLWTSARVSEFYGSSAAASVDAELKLKPFLSVVLGAGNYLSNPYQNFPGGTFFTAGVRFNTVPAPRPVLDPHSTTSATPTPGPLVPVRRGDTLVVRFAMPKATSVAIAGDWNTWTPDTLHRVGADIWEATLLVPAGTYHFNLLVDGKDWVVPGGVATVPDGLGGKVAVLLVF